MSSKPEIGQVYERREENQLEWNVFLNGKIVIEKVVPRTQWDMNCYVYVVSWEGVREQFNEIMLAKYFRLCE